MSRLPVFLIVALVTVALAPSASSRSTAAAETARPPVLSKRAQRGLAFAQARCATCHGVSAGASSPNPESPPFEAVVNQPGLTRSTLSQFLRDSHNFPGAMNFTVAPAQIDDLAVYMLTLKSRRYRPAI